MKKSLRLLMCQLRLQQSGRYIFVGALLFILTACGSPVLMTTTPRYQLSGATQSGSFGIDRVQLEFSPGISRLTISRGTQVSPVATIKFRGRGHFQAHWLLDRQLIEQLNMTLDHGSVLNLSPTRPINTASLSPGEHRVILQINNPPTSFKNPEVILFLAD